jgi:NAD+ kinase
MRLGIFANMDRPDTDKVIRRIINWAEQNDVALCFSESISEMVGGQRSFLPPGEMPKKADVVVSLGGDGTLLATARAVGRHGNPILGINVGSLGFLTQQTPNVLEEALTAVLEKKYKIEKRMMAKVRIEGGSKMDYPYALNDVVVDRGSVSRMIHLDLFADDYFICSYAADGLIISTPTGSTAYSLAVGGPILHPLMGAFIVSPISAFALTTRPIVFSENVRLRVYVRSAHSDPVLTLDGQVACNLTRESSLIVHKADYYINFIVFRKNSFYDILRAKLHWGRLPEGRPGRPSFN